MFLIVVVEVKPAFMTGQHVDCSGKADSDGNNSCLQLERCLGMQIK